VGDVDPCGVPADAAVGRDLSGLEVSGVVGRLELVWEETGRGFVDRGWGPLVYSLVGPDLVEITSEGVEATLLSGPVPGGRDGGVGLEVSVHFSMASSVRLSMAVDTVAVDIRLARYACGHHLWRAAESRDVGTRRRSLWFDEAADPLGARPRRRGSDRRFDIASVSD